MTVLMSSQNAHERSDNAETKNSIADQELIKQKVDSIKARLAISEKDQKKALQLINEKIYNSSSKGKYKLKIDNNFFGWYSNQDKIKHYELDISDLEDDCAEQVNDEKRGKRIARTVVKQLTDKHLPLSERYYSFTDNDFEFKITNAYRLLDYCKKALIEAGYQVQYQKFSRHMAIVIRW